MIVDAHLDLAMNAIEWNRDLSRPIAEIRSREQGQTDFLVLINRFAASGTIGEMDCVYSSWTTDAPGGFSDGQIDALQRLVPSLALAAKCASLARIAETLVETYLGRDAGRRVLSGRIARGVADGPAAAFELLRKGRPVVKPTRGDVSFVERIAGRLRGA